MKHGGKKIWNKTNSYIAILIEFISEVRVIKRKESRTVTFTLGDMVFEYDEENSEAEDRYDTIGDLSAGYANAPSGETVIGNIGSFMGEITDIVFVVYKIHVIISNVSSRTQAIKKGAQIGQLKILLEPRRNTTQPSIPGSILVKI